ncbi:AAA family ATPase, partial [Kitasatospora sp. Root107]
MVLMCGLPGAGKTTYAMDLVRRHAAETGGQGDGALEGVV